MFAVKGNPEEVLQLCRRHVDNGEIRELDDDFRAVIRSRNERMAGAALRVLGFAYREADSTSLAHDQGLIWIGMVGSADPPREGMRDLVNSFHRAGIRTIMLTGDQSATAYAVGKHLNLSGSNELEIIDSNKLEEIAPEVLTALARRVHIFSRVNPSHKLQIVQALQRAGAIVAMTGDGINDGPALKAANVGVAMGKGAEVAREVADVILVGDDVEGLLSAIAQGRSLSDDIKKAVHFIVSSNLSEVLIMFSAVAVGLGAPLNPRQLLWINLLTDVFPELALAVEPPEGDVLATAPRVPRDSFFAREESAKLAVESGVMTASALTAYGWGLARYGYGPQSSAMAFLSLTAAQLLHTISSRSQRHTIFDRKPLPHNEFVPMAIGAGFAVELLSLLVPWFRKLLGSAPLRGADLLVVGGTAAASLLTNEAIKFVGNHSGRREHLPPAAEVNEGAVSGETVDYE
jgi:Ca2+-transporting ATPase